MTPITKYQADDGSQWNNEEDALKRDALCKKVDAVMLPLGKTPKGVKDGKGWMQHNPERVLRARDGILDICREQGFGHEVFKKRGRDCHPMSFIGRYLDDVGGPLNTAWQRFCRIDEHGREHQLPYFAYTSKPDPEHVCVAIQP